MKRKAQRKLMIERERYVLSWLRQHRTIDVCDALFHASYHKRFGGTVRFKMFGASPVNSAMRTMVRLFQAGQVSRVRIGISGGEGFPTWVYVYTLPTDNQLNLGLTKSAA